MKILIFCPTAPRLEPEVFDSVMGQDGFGFTNWQQHGPSRETCEAVFNQHGVEFVDYMFTRDNPHVLNLGGAFKNIQLNYKKMIRLAKEKVYDKIWIVESDTIPPTDALMKLLNVNAPVVSGLYVLRHGVPVPNLMRAEQSPGMGSNFSWADIKEHWGETVEISGGCMGCLLLDAEVLADFDYTEHLRYPDIPLMYHCVEKGFKQMARLDVLCGHKKPNGEVLWPQDYIHITRKEARRA